MDDNLLYLDFIISRDQIHIYYLQNIYGLKLMQSFDLKEKELFDFEL